VAPPRPWTDAELATLAELAETYVRGGAVRRAGLAADALLASADPEQVGQLRLVLRLMESRAANLVLNRRPTRFRDLSPADREAYLLDWGHSPLALRRAAFTAFRTLLTFLAYADPGTSGAGNPLLAALGYEPDDPPVAAALTPVRAVDLAADGTDDVELDADVVIVGSGAGGGVVAAELARAGRSVVVVEAGGLFDEATMPRDELAAYDDLYLNHGLLTTWDGSVTMLAGGAVGGGTTVNWMTCIDAPEDVRQEWATEHGVDGAVGAEWDEDRATIEAELGVAESVVVPPKDEAILRGAASLGWEAARTRRDATDCGDCGACPFGCRRGTKQSGLRAHLATAVGAGARLVVRAPVSSVLIEGGRAVGVVAELLPSAESGPTGPGAVGPGAARDVAAVRRRLVVRASQVVLAAGALRSATILEASGLEHAGVGQGLRIHPVPLVAGIFDAPIDMWRGTLQAARSLEFNQDDEDHRRYAIESAPGHPGLIALALPWQGTDEHATLMRQTRSVAPFIAITRDGGQGRVRLTKNGAVRIDYELDAAGIATMRHALVSLARLARAAGARRIVAVGSRPAWHEVPSGRAGDEARAFTVYEDALRVFDFSPNRGSVFSAHQMGTARLGADPTTHPVDPRGHVRTGGRTTGDGLVRGLYVADASLFPTAIGVNPMITVMTLARRVARTVLAEG
jgi:choline dehydrogenase-like flavoprotein